MKIIRLVCLRLLLLTSACAGGRAASAELPPESQPTELYTDFHPHPYGKLDRRGRLLFQELYQDGFPAGWHRTKVCYPHGSQGSYQLSRDVTAINAFLAAQVYRPTTVRTFIKENLTFFLIGSLGDSPSIITPREVEKGLGSDPIGHGPSFRQLEAMRLRAKVRPYALPSEPVVKGNG